MDYEQSEEAFLDFLNDYKTGKIPQLKEPGHSAIMILAEDLELAKSVYESKDFSEGKRDGYIPLEEMIKKLSKDKK